jgi:hypothetical protein
MLIIVALVAAVGACAGIYLNDVLGRQRLTLTREGLIGEGYDADDMADAIADPRVSRFGMLRVVSNGVGLIFVSVSAVLLYAALFTDMDVTGRFWVAWASNSAAAALFFWTGR